MLRRKVRSKNMDAKHLSITKKGTIRKRKLQEAEKTRKQIHSSYQNQECVGQVCALAAVLGRGGHVRLHLRNRTLSLRHPLMPL